MIVEQPLIPLHNTHMTTPLARWLTEKREALLPRWIVMLEHSLYAVHGNGTHAATPDELSDTAEVIVSHPDERRVLLTSIYEGLISAAGGDYGPLEDCLRMLRALRTSPGEDELPQHLALTFQLRRTIWDLIFNENGTPSNGVLHDDAQQLATELDRLIEYITVTMASRWVTAARLVSRELHETKMLVESLYHDAEATDRTTLHVSNLNDITQGLAASLDQAQQLSIVGSKLRGALQAASVSIWQPDAQGKALHCVGFWGQNEDGSAGEAQDEQPLPNWKVKSEHPDDIIARTFRLGDMILEPELDAKAQGKWYEAPNVVLAMPLVSARHVIGVIVVQDHTGLTLHDRSEQEFVRSAASQTAIALENARLYEEVRSFNAVLEQRIAERTSELQVERDTLETLNAIALDISSTLDEQLLMQSSLNAIATLVGVTHGSIRLLDRETEHLVDSAVLGRTEGVGYQRFPLGQGIIGWVAQNRKSALVPDISQDSRWVTLPEQDDGEEREHKKHGSMIAVPLIAHHELQGVLVLSHDKVGYFNEAHQRLVEAAANQIATGIHNALIYKQVEQDLLRRYEMQQAQEQAVSQSNAILQSLSDGVIVCDSFGSVITVNPAAERILERPLEELLIWNMPELIKRLMGRRADELPVEEVLALPRDEQNTNQVYSTNFHIGTRVVSATLNPVLSTEKQTPIGALAVFRDITREVESDRLKTEFIGTVSHELRTPMTSIKGFTQLLVMGSLGPVNDTQKEFLNIIQANSERMIAIINDLLDITKIESGSVELDMRSLHVAEALSSVVLELQSKVQERSQELAISIPPGLPLVRADSRRFNQILFNLFSNAVKYTPRNGKIILEAHEVGIEVVPEAMREGLKPDRRYVQVDVRDTGVGIALDEQERIFDRFYRTENPLKVEAGGTGLGLSLVRPLVSLFGGRIWVQSAIGEGSTFSFVLPAL